MQELVLMITLKMNLERLFLLICQKLVKLIQKKMKYVWLSQ
ncbi:UNVERIFIED_CONTAM: hypothetical protein GTU68_047235 [Idotea baltica]|nr:hypothetical protein [Idotea baltica]